MYRILVTVCVAAALMLPVTGHRQRRVVGGQPASPPPPGASEAEDVVENPALVSAPPPPPPPPPANSVTTSARPAVYDDNSPIVFLRRGRRQAKLRGVKEDDGVYAFKGIRYAEPPVGPYRFQRPRRTRLEGDVDATHPGPPCPQTLGQRLVGAEDCLFLNVFSPQIPRDSSGQKYPVLFWIHGGGFRRGSGSQYGAADLVKKGLVVVTIQYRLGSLGFLSTSRKELPGNAGLFDMTSALHWVRRHVQFFGGDPGRIIPSGQGSGASAAVMLTLAHLTKDWIKGVFAMSGSAISSFAVDEEPARTAGEVSAIDSCQGLQESLAFVRCMQRLPVESVLRGDDKLQENRLKKDSSADNYVTSISKLLCPGPAVEGEDDFRFLPNFLTGTPLETLQKGDFARVPLLTGVTKDETSTSAKGGGISSQLLNQVAATEELLESLVPKLLSVNTGIFGNNTLSPLVKGLFSNTKYLKGITSTLGKAGSALDKVIEMTTDALFNLPAFLTSQLWSKQSKAFLYSFQHETRSAAASDFLQDLPLAQQGDTPVQGVGHGDDLVYLFDLRSVEGEAVQTQGLQDTQDSQVREHFTSLVAEFARSGEPSVGGQRMLPFTQETGDYLILDATPRLDRGFRKCQMGLWAGLGSVLKSAECSFLQLGDLVGGLGTGVLDATRGATSQLGKPLAPLAPLTNSASGLGGATSTLGKPLAPLTPLTNSTGLTSSLGGLLGGAGGNRGGYAAPASTSTTRKPSILGGLG